MSFPDSATDLPAGILTPNECFSFLADAPIGVYLTTPQGRFLYANTALARMLGYASGQELVDSIVDIATQVYIDPAHRQWFLRTLEEQGQIVGQEFCFFKKDGSLVWVSENARKVGDVQDNTLCYHGFCVDVTARKITEEKLQKQEEIYRQLFETMSQGVVYQDGQGRVTLANPAAERILGYTTEQMRGHKSSSPIWEVVDEFGHFLPEADHPAMVALRTRKPVEHFIVGVRSHPQTDYTWISVNATPLFYADTSRPSQVYIIIEDVTAKRLAEMRYHTLFQEMITGFALHEIICDPKGKPVNYRFLDVNPAFESLVGLAKTDVVGQTVLDFFPDIDQSLIENYGHVALTGESMKFEYYLAELEKYFEINAFCPVPGQFACIFLDITKRKKISLILAEQERKYRFLAESIDDVIWISNLDLCFTYVSPSIYKLRGINPEEALLEPMEKSLTAESVQRVQDAAQQLSSKQQSAQDSVLRLELEQYHHNGSTIWVEAVVRPLFDNLGQVNSYLGVTRDISEARALREQLEKAAKAAQAANKAKSEFLANMSHEIRTPLNGIMGMLQLLQMTTLDNEQEKYVQLSLISAERLTRLLADILDLSRVEAGKMELFATEFSIRDLHESVLQLFVIQAQEKSIALRCYVDPAIPEIVVGDEVRIRQILFNLVGNALKFTSSGQIIVSFLSLPPARQEALRILITVEDTGSGISEEGLHRIFQPFSQLDSSYSRTHQGAGLGLAIVRRLVELMDGHIQIESIPGQGTSIHVVLPLDLPGPKQVPETKTPAISETCKSLRILVAEDEPCNQETTVHLVRSLGHEVTLAENGGQVLDLLRQYDFDCILMDIQMPILDGVQATKAIRSGEIKGKSAIPIIALTAYAMPDEREEFLKAGLTDYLSKPILIKELQRVLSQVGGQVAIQEEK